MDARAVVVSDGKRGHENQSRVIAQMVGDSSPLLMRLRDNVQEGGLTEWLLRLRLRLAGGARLAPQAAAGLVKRHLVPEDNRAFRDFATDVRSSGVGGAVVISAGTPPTTFNLVLSTLLSATSIVIMTPSLLPRRFFGLNIVPSHDWRDATPPPNVILSSLALAHLDEAAAELLAGRLVREHGLAREQPYWGLALGGPSKSAQWDAAHLQTQLESVLSAANAAQAQLLVTTSRRTPDWCTRWLKERIAAGAPIAYLLDAATDPLNPLPAFYMLCRRMLVSADSFSMVSEAANAGFRVDLLSTSPAARQGKLARSLAVLIEQGLAVEFATETNAASSGTDRHRPWPANWHYDELRRAVRLKLDL